MIVVKHRWMKNRNQRFGNTNLSFNNEGIALVADAGNARLDVEGYVRHSKGLAKIVDPTVDAAPKPEPVQAQEPFTEPVPESVDSREIKKEPEIELPEPEEVIEKKPVKELFEETPSKRKPPGKKKKTISKKK